MKFISWNVNGIRACVTKGFLDFFNEVDADIFCLQETKLQEGQIELRFTRISSILELCRKERIFRNSYIYKDKNLLTVNIWN